jgi:Ala-tRNA(Pro) deacylase
MTAETYRRLITLLDSNRARYRLIHHAAEGRTDLASAHRRHPVAQAAKSLVVRVKLSKRKRRYVLAVIPGDRFVDLARLSHLFGGMGAAFATKDVAEELAGSVSGSILPFSFDPELEVVVDRGLLVHDELYFNAARLDRSVALHTEDYLALASPPVEDIATHTAPAPLSPRGQSPLQSEPNPPVLGSQAPRDPEAPN